MKIKIMWRDNVFRLLFINMFLVLIGYASAYIIGKGFVGSIRVLKTIIVLISFVYVISLNGFSIKNLLNEQIIYIVVSFIFIASFFGSDSFRSLYRGITFIFPFLYVVYSINYLLRYGAYNLLVSFSLLLLIVYAIVPISYLFFGADLSRTVIYGETEGEAFVSNHYGWGSTIYILSAFTVLKYYPLKKVYRLLIIIFLPFVFYLLMISANRSGMLALAIAFFFFIIKDRHHGIASKLIVLAIPVIIIFFISLQENSVLDFLQQKNEQQIETGEEGRLINAIIMTDYFNDNPVLWVSGIGMFNYEILDENDTYITGYHNSYFDVLFGVGIIIFLFFFYLMVYWPFKVYWRTTASYSLLIFPLMIIPLFEGDLTAGQFLFFPWFIYMILLNAKEFHPQFKDLHD